MGIFIFISLLSIVVNIYYAFVVIPKLRRSDPDQVIISLRMILIYLKGVRYNVPGYSCENLETLIEQEIETLEDEQPINSRKK